MEDDETCSTSSKKNFITDKFLEVASELSKNVDEVDASSDIVPFETLDHDSTDSSKFSFPTSLFKTWTNLKLPPSSFIPDSESEGSETKSLVKMNSLLSWPKERPNQIMCIIMILLISVIVTLIINMLIVGMHILVIRSDIQYPDVKHFVVKPICHLENVKYNTLIVVNNPSRYSFKITEGRISASDSADRSYLMQTEFMFDQFIEPGRNDISIDSKIEFNNEPLKRMLKKAKFQDLKFKYRIKIFTTAFFVPISFWYSDEFKLKTDTVELKPDFKEIVFHSSDKEDLFFGINSNFDGVLPHYLHVQLPRIKLQVRDDESRNLTNIAVDESKNRNLYFSVEMFGKDKEHIVAFLEKGLSLNSGFKGNMLIQEIGSKSCSIADILTGLMIPFDISASSINLVKSKLDPLLKHDKRSYEDKKPMFSIDLFSAQNSSFFFNVSLDIGQTYFKDIRIKGNLPEIFIQALMSYSLDSFQVAKIGVAPTSLLSVDSLLLFQLQFEILNMTGVLGAMNYLMNLDLPTYNGNSTLILTGTNNTNLASGILSLFKTEIEKFSIHKPSDAILCPMTHSATILAESDADKITMDIGLEFHNQSNFANSPYGKFSWKELDFFIDIDAYSDIYHLIVPSNSFRFDIWNNVPLACLFSSGGFRSRILIAAHKGEREEMLEFFRHGLVGIIRGDEDLNIKLKGHIGEELVDSNFNLVIPWSSILRKLGSFSSKASTPSVLWTRYINGVEIVGYDNSMLFELLVPKQLHLLGEYIPNGMYWELLLNISRLDLNFYSESESLMIASVERPCLEFSFGGNGGVFPLDKNSNLLFLSIKTNNPHVLKSLMYPIDIEPFRSNDTDVSLMTQALNIILHASRNGIKKQVQFEKHFIKNEIQIPVDENLVWLIEPTIVSDSNLLTASLVLKIPHNNTFRHNDSFLAFRIKSFDFDLEQNGLNVGKLKLVKDLTVHAYFSEKQFLGFHIDQAEPRVVLELYDLVEVEKLLIKGSFKQKVEISLRSILNQISMEKISLPDETKLGSLKILNQSDIYLPCVSPVRPFICQEEIFDPVVYLEWDINWIKKYVTDFFQSIEYFLPRSKWMINALPAAYVVNFKVPKLGLDVHLNDKLQWNANSDEIVGSLRYEKGALIGDIDPVPVSMIFSNHFNLLELYFDHETVQHHFDSILPQVVDKNDISFDLFSITRIVSIKYSKVTLLSSLLGSYYENIWDMNFGNRTDIFETIISFPLSEPKLLKAIVSINVTFPWWPVTLDMKKIVISFNDKVIGKASRFTLGDNRIQSIELQVEVDDTNSEIITNVVLKKGVLGKLSFNLGSSLVHLPFRLPRQERPMNFAEATVIDWNEWFNPFSPSLKMIVKNENDFLSIKVNSLNATVSQKVGTLIQGGDVFKYIGRMIGPTKCAHIKDQVLFKKCSLQSSVTLDKKIGNVPAKGEFTAKFQVSNFPSHTVRNGACLDFKGIFDVALGLDGSNFFDLPMKIHVRNYGFRNKIPVVGDYGLVTDICNQMNRCNPDAKVQMDIEIVPKDFKVELDMLASFNMQFTAKNWLKIRFMEQGSIRNISLIIANTLILETEEKIIDSGNMVSRSVPMLIKYDAISELLVIQQAYGDKMLFTKFHIKLYKDMIVKFEEYHCWYSNLNFNVKNLLVSKVKAINHKVRMNKKIGYSIGENKFYYRATDSCGNVVVDLGLKFRLVGIHCHWCQYNGVIEHIVVQVKEKGWLELESYFPKKGIYQVEVLETDWINVGKVVVYH